MSRSNTFSLTVMVIIMALLAIFVGYLLGNWLIQMVTGDTSESRQVTQEKIVEEEIVEDEEESEGSSANGSENDLESKIDESEIKNQLKGEVFVVQVGAFKNYNNAVGLKEELEAEGFQVAITDKSPYKVQLGATTDREEAEKAKEKVEIMGYEAFVTH